MTVPERSRRRVGEAVERLEREYGSFPAREATWDVSRERYGWHVERVERDTLGGAGVWCVDDEGRVLLVREAGAWSEPAGKHEPGESLEETARREAREEAGIDCELAGVALAQVVDVAHGERPPIRRLIVTFAAEHRAGTARPGEPEIEAVRWWAEHPPPEELAYEALADIPIPPEVG